MLKLLSNLKHNSLVVLIFFGTYATLFAQVNVVPLTTRTVPQVEQKLENQRNIRFNHLAKRGTVTLPFIDDFSNEGPYPNPTLWMDDQVFINRSFVVNPPSIGIASFDGLDAIGDSYGGPRGRSDYLTSMPIDLTGADESRLYLTFYLQAGGNTLAPTKKDSFGVEFKDINGSWINIERYNVNTLAGSRVFNFFEIKIEPAYIHDNFQFRFYNISDNYGILNVWNLDYVRLKEFFQSDREVETDVAFSNNLGSIFKEHYAIPIKHIKNNVAHYLRDSVDISIRNNFNAKLQADPSFLSVIDEESESTLLPEETLLEVVNVPINQRDLNPGIYQFRNAIKNKSALESNLSQLLNTNKDIYAITKRYKYVQTQESNDQLIANNDVSQTFELGQIFAYDDGSAEIGIEILKAAGQTPTMAIEFEALVPDTIQAISIHLPHAELINENQLFQLFVWGDDLNDDVLWSSGEISPLYPDDFDNGSLQAFSTFRLRDEFGNDTPLPIPAGKFHIGWTQVTPGDDGVVFGYDKESPFGSFHSFYTTGNNWQPFRTTFFNGSIMMRPVLSGPKQFAHTATSEIERRSALVQLRPNPVEDYVHLDIPDDAQVTSVEVLNTIGQVVLQSKEVKTIFVGNLPEGKYIINLLDKTNHLYGTKGFIRL